MASPMPARSLCVALLLLGCQPPPPVAAETPAPTQAAMQPARAAADGCDKASLAVQVLGSGGPIPDDARASSGYVVWRNGQSFALIDAGGGVFLRFGEAGARIDDLELIAISHLHADHVVDLAALLKGGYFAGRERALPIVGPSGNERFPAMDAYLEALLGKERGAYRYLSGYLTGEGLFPLDVRTIDASERVASVVLETSGVALHAVGIHHGVIPSLGFMLSVDGKRVAFSGDQSADNQAFEAMIAGADLLIVHHALPEQASQSVTHLHRTPSQIGALAAAAGVKRVVLSHHMQRALRDLDGGLSAIAKRYEGVVDVAQDLSCYTL